MMLRWLILFAMAVPLKAATWYVSPLATAGTGSISDPWPLQTALTNKSAIGSGDTVLLRGGTYLGTRFYSTLVGVTVKSYPGEWAVISEGANGALGTTMATDTTEIVVTNSESFRVSAPDSSSVISIGQENIQLAGRTSPTNWSVVRGWNGTTAITHAQGDAVWPFGGSVIYQSGTNCVFQGFEITSLMTTNRVSNEGFYPGGGLDLHGKGNKAINLVIHDTGHPGIGFWSQSTNGEVNGCLFWGIGQYDYAAAGGFKGSPRGTAIYSQNSGGMAQIKNCIVNHELTDGAEIFGETGPVQDFTFDGNIAFANGIPLSLEIASGSSSTSNTWMINNFLMDSPTLSYVSLSNSAEYVYGNVIVNGGAVLKETTAFAITNNTFFITKGVGVAGCPIQYQSTHFSSNSLNGVWDYNPYYIGDGSSSFQWAFVSSEGVANNGGNMTFAQWKAATGFDAHSTCTNWPTDYLRVQSFALDYDSNRHFVGVINTTPATSATLDLGANGFRSGDIYTLRDAQNYFTVIAQGVYSGSALTLPLNLTNIATLQGSVTNFVPEHTNVQQPGLFNAFVLDRTDGGGSIAQLNVGTLIVR